MLRHHAVRYKIAWFFIVFLTRSIKFFSILHFMCPNDHICHCYKIINKGVYISLKTTIFIKFQISTSGLSNFVLIPFILISFHSSSLVFSLNKDMWRPQNSVCKTVLLESMSKMRLLSAPGPCQYKYEEVYIWLVQGRRPKLPLSEFLERLYVEW